MTSGEEGDNDHRSVPLFTYSNRIQSRFHLPFTSWTQQDRSRTPSTPIWSSKLYKSARDDKSTLHFDSKGEPSTMYAAALDLVIHPINKRRRPL